MTGKNSSWASAKQARLLLDPANFRLVEALRAGQPSAAEVARTLNLPLTRVHYLLRRLVDAGVARVVAVERRAGRPVRRYAVEHDWFIPFEVTPASTLEELVAGHARTLMDRFVHGLTDLLQEDRHGWGFQMTYSSVDGLSMTVAGPDGQLPLTREPFVAAWLGLHMPRERALELRERLHALLREYDQPDAPGAAPFTVGLFMSPGRPL